MKDQDHTKLPTGRDIPLLAIGVIGIGTSGPIIAKSLIPVPSLIFLRNLIGGLVILCFFWSMRLTSVATGTALTATQPIFAALYIKFKGGHIPRRSIGGMMIAFFSVLVITGVDLTLSIRSFQGDLLAILGGALAASYVLISSKVQKEISTSTFTSVCYLVCSISVLPVVILSGSPVTGFALNEWILLAALVIGAQLLGHTLFNLSLKRVSPVVVSLIVFFEVPVSAVIALIWLGQQPPAGTIPGIIGLVFGCALFVLRSNQDSVVKN